MTIGKRLFVPRERSVMMRAACAILLVASCGWAGGTASPASLDGAHWIWSGRSSSRPSESAHAGTVYFRAGFAVTEQSAIKSAELIVTADNLFEAHLNGQFVGESVAAPNAWNEPKRFDITEFVKPGQNVLAIGALNAAPGPAGLLARVCVRLADGQEVILVSDSGWKCSEKEEANWRESDCNDQHWDTVRNSGAFGIKPWSRFGIPSVMSPTGRRDKVTEPVPPADYHWPDGIVFIGDDCSLYRPSSGTGTSYDSLAVTTFTRRNTRAFPEYDLPAPMKVGHKLLALRPARPGTEPKVLLDAGSGAVGSPSVSFDGHWILVSMVPAGESFYHLYKLPAAGGVPVRLTEGPFHDIDPVELPDGRIAFTSTRAGTFDEYHGSPSRALFAMAPDGTDIQPLTHTFIFDNEPEVLADGRLLFIRSDNFFDRGKVETLLHATFPDGTHGQTEFGLDLGPEYGSRLRAFDCGSPAPMPDGRVAYLTGSSIAVGWPGCLQKDVRHIRVPAGDVAALPDGRLLCTLEPRASIQAKRNGFQRIALIDPVRPDEPPVILHNGATALHSPVYLGQRVRPPVLPRSTLAVRPTGVLFCQNARLTQNTTAGWKHVRAIRVLAGRGLTTRSSHSYIVHAGSEVEELGTVPLEPDGSFAVEVPADTAIALQAVDAEGRSELNEMSWITVRPGETRGCVGCHQSRQKTPVASAGLIRATGVPPLKLTGCLQSHRFRGNNAAVTGLMELQFDRFREVAGLNRHTVLSAALIAMLKDPQAETRAAAAQRLAIDRDATAAPALAAGLKDPVREVRVASALALAACGTRDSVQSLVAVEQDSDPLVRQAIALARENLTGHPGVGVPDWNGIESNLVEQIEHGDGDAVRRAAVALGHTGRGERARVSLRAYLVRERDHNPYPQWRRTHHGDNMRFNALSEANPRTLQAVARALGGMRDAQSVPLLADTLTRHCDPATGNLFLAEAVAEALGKIGTAGAEAALIKTFAGLKDYPQFTAWYGDHNGLVACHASPLHYYILEALDELGSTNCASLIPAVVKSMPIDCDRGLMFESDDYETLAGRLIRRNDPGDSVVGTCLAILGDPAARKTAVVEQALRHVHGAWAGTPGPEHRAAQVLSAVCRDRRYGARILAALNRYQTRAVSISRVYNRGIPVVNELPVRHWVCFFLARTTGTLEDPKSVDGLLAVLENSTPEGAAGAPDPLGPGVLFLHNDLTPCWRAAVVWALGRIGDERAASTLLKLAGDLRNAPDTRHAAAVALGRCGGPSTRAAVAKLADGYPEMATRMALLEACARCVASPR